MNNFCRSTFGSGGLPSILLSLILGISLLLGGCVDSGIQLTEGIGGTGIVRGFVGTGGATPTGSSTNNSTPPTSYPTLNVAGIQFDISHVTQKNCHGDINTVTTLGIRQLIEVEGTILPDGKTGIATVVKCSTLLDGPVTGVYDGSSSLYVMQQAVIIDSRTLLYGLKASDIQLGDTVIASGYTDAQGQLHASDLKKTTRTSLDDGVFNVGGVISQLDTNLLTFHINGLVVDYAYASIIDLPTTGLANGLHVHVTSLQALEKGTMQASEVAILANTPLAAGTPYRTQGYISRAISSTEFEVAGQRIVVTPTTSFPHGGSAALSTKTLVQVNGIIGTNNAVIADEINVLNGTTTSQPNIAGTSTLTSDTTDPSHTTIATGTATTNTPPPIDIMGLIIVIANADGTQTIIPAPSDTTDLPTRLIVPSEIEAEPTSAPVLDSPFTLQAGQQEDN